MQYPASKVLIAAGGCIIISIITGFVFSYILRNMKIRTAAEIRGEVVNTVDQIVKEVAVDKEV
ncbi:MAG: hypothetical protein RSC21_06720 [Cetobacterium sp.]